ncbi:hypothetical protein [Nitriliruptor alkaliphilus]|nr:hypothetical protein [Nitriliruptor alkaliphilus]
MGEATVRLDRDGPVAIISLDRPQKHNAADDGPAVSPASAP